MANESFSRKDFLKRVSLFGATIVGTSTILAACGGGGGATAETDPCADLTGVAEADKQMRTTLAYVKAGQDPAKRCDNCQLYVEPAEGASCGGCTLFKGPVHPGGYCNSWVAKMT